MHHKYSLAILQPQTRRILSRGTHHNIKKFAQNWGKSVCQKSKANGKRITRMTNNAICARQIHVLNVHTGTVKVYHYRRSQIKPKIMTLGGTSFKINHSVKTKYVRSYKL